MMGNALLDLCKYPAMATSHGKLIYTDVIELLMDTYPDEGPASLSVMKVSPRLVLCEYQI